MATSKRELIILALVAKLEAATGDPVFRSPSAAVDKERAFVIDWSDERVSPEGNNVHDNVSLAIHVSAYAKDIASPESIADEMIIIAHAAVMADRALGGLCLDLNRNGATKRIEQHDKVVIALRQSYVCEYRHIQHDLTQ